MPGMMHHNCRLGCCLRGSRTEDKEHVRRELHQEFLSDVPPEVEWEEQLAHDWLDTYAPHVLFADDVPALNAGALQPRVWSF